MSLLLLVACDDFFDFSRHLFENCLKIKSLEKRKALANIINYSHGIYATSKIVTTSL